MHQINPVPLAPAPLSRDEFSLRSFARLVALRWKVPVITGVIGLALAAGLLTQIRPTYTVTMRIAPVQTVGGSRGASSLAKAAGLPASLIGGQTDTPFSRYKTALQTVALAERLADRHGVMQVIYKNQWDEKTGSFIPREGLGSRLLGPIYYWPELRSKTIPTPVALKQFLFKAVTITSSKDDVSVELSMEWPDREFAKRLLSAVNAEANDMLREQAAARARQMMDYLRERLNTVTTQEHRLDLGQLIMEQEQALLLAQPGVAYAAEVIDPPSASDLPSSPKPILLLLVGLFSGIVMGLVVLLIKDALSSTASKPGAGLRAP